MKHATSAAIPALTALFACLLLAGCLSGPASDLGIDAAPYVSKRSFPDGAKPAAQDGKDLLQEINRTRLRLGAAPLRPDARLDAIAARQNDFMARQGRMSHDGFDERFALSGSDHCVENLAWNYPNAESTVQGWLNSPQHRTNLLDPEITHAGTALGRGYATFFACRRSLAPPSE
jgi:uncharacterized protein YkwD